MPMFSKLKPKGEHLTVHPPSITASLNCSFYPVVKLISNKIDSDISISVVTRYIILAGLGECISIQHHVQPNRIHLFKLFSVLPKYPLFTAIKWHIICAIQLICYTNWDLLLRNS